MRKRNLKMCTSDTEQEKRNPQKLISFPIMLTDRSRGFGSILLHNDKGFCCHNYKKIT